MLAAQRREAVGLIAGAAVAEDGVRDRARQRARIMQRARVAVVMGRSTERVQQIVMAAVAAGGAGVSVPGDIRGTDPLAPPIELNALATAIQGRIVGTVVYKQDLRCAIILQGNGLTGAGRHAKVIM